MRDAESILILVLLCTGLLLLIIFCVWISIENKMDEISNQIKDMDVIKHKEEK